MTGVISPCQTPIFPRFILEVTIGLTLEFTVADDY